MDLRKVKKLIELVEESGIAELEVKSGEEAVRITMSPQTGAQAMDLGGREVHEPGPAAPMAAQPSNSASGKPLAAPLAGTFYVAASPDAAPFVAIGDAVTRGQPLCIIESMKMMNTIEAERSGRILDCLVGNGEPVEAGQALFLID